MINVQTEKLQLSKYMRRQTINQCKIKRKRTKLELPCESTPFPSGADSQILLKVFNINALT